MDINKVKSSDRGTANHIPVIPNNFGKIIINKSKNTKERSIDIKVDTFPFENAVKRLDVKIFKPIKR